MRCTLREHHRQQQQQQICSPNIDLSIIRCELCPTDCCVALAFFFFGKYFAHAAYTWHFFGVSCALSFHTAAAADWSSTNEKKKRKTRWESCVPSSILNCRARVRYGKVFQLIAAATESTDESNKKKTVCICDFLYLFFSLSLFRCCCTKPKIAFLIFAAVENRQAKEEEIKKTILWDVLWVEVVWWEYIIGALCHWNSCSRNRTEQIVSIPTVERWHNSGVGSRCVEWLYGIDLSVLIGNIFRRQGQAIGWHIAQEHDTHTQRENVERTTMNGETWETRAGEHSSGRSQLKRTTIHQDQNVPFYLTTHTLGERRRVRTREWNVARG